MATRAIIIYAFVKNGLIRVKDGRASLILEGLLYMRLAVINPHMRAEYSGPTVFMNRLFGQLSRDAGMKITAVGAELPKVKADGLVYVRLRTPDLRGALGQGLWAVKTILWLLRHQNSYDLVHFHGAFFFNLVGALAPLVFRKPFVILPLGAGGDLRTDARSNKFTIIRRLKRFILIRTHRAFALSEANAHELQSWGVPEIKIVSIFNPASEDFFQAPPPNKQGGHHILFVGKIGSGKNPDLVIEALSILLRAGWSNVRLTMVGPFNTPQDEQTLTDLVDALDLNAAVKFTGYVQNTSKIMKDLPNAVFVLPSSQEGLPGALTEAMALGIPAVVTDVGSMGDVVGESSCGYVIDPDANEIATALERIWRDDNTWYQLATAAHSYAMENFSEESVAKVYMDSLRLGEVR